MMNIKKPLLFVSVLFFYDLSASAANKVDKNKGFEGNRLSQDLQGESDKQKALDGQEQTKWIDLGYNPIMIAAVKGDVAAIEKNLAQDPQKKVNIKNKNGKTALMLIAENPAHLPSDVQLKIGELLLAQGAQVDALDKQRTSALMYASVGGNKAFVDMLIKAKANVNTPDINGWTALMWAVLADQLPVVESLLQVKANVKLPNNKKQTVFDIAKTVNPKKYNPILTKAKVEQELREKNGRLTQEHEAVQRTKK